MGHGNIVDVKLLFEKDEQYPTNFHTAEFWEQFGRTVATYGFLENVLLKALFVMGLTREFDECEIEAAFQNWIRTIERAMSDPLGPLIDKYEKSVLDNQNATISNLEDLISDLREASHLRNALCHGFWEKPDKNGASVPFFMNRQRGRFTTPIDIEFLRKTQRNVAVLACHVVNTVTHMGYQFPGSAGPGMPIIETGNHH